MSLSSTELNYLIWRYLQESGYDVAAFAFDKQSLCLKYEENKHLDILSKVEPGFLVNLVQKGILYSLTEDELHDNKLRSEVLTFFGALLNNEQEIALNNNLSLNGGNGESNGTTTTNNNNMVNHRGSLADNNGNNMEVDDDKSFETKYLSPLVKFDESLLSKWNPTTDILAYINHESNLVLTSLNNDQFIDNKMLRNSGINKTFTTFSWSPLGNLIVTSSISGDLSLWSSDGDLRNMTKGVLTNDADVKLGYIVEIMWSLNGQFFITIDSHGRMVVWDSATLNLIQEMTSTSNDVNNWSVCWLDNFKFATSLKSSSILIYQITNDGVNHYNIKVIADLKGHEGIASNLKFNHDSKYLSSYCEIDGVVKLWLNSVTAGEFSLTLNNHKKIPPIVSMDWINQGNNLLTVSIDGTIIIWDIAEKSIKYHANIFKDDSLYNFATIKTEHDNDDNGSLVYASVISPNEQWLVIGDDLGKVTIWDIRSPLQCKGIWNNIDTSILNSNNGLCDISWDTSSRNISVAYKGTSSIIIPWTS